MSGMSRHPGLKQSRATRHCLDTVVVLLVLSACQTTTPTMSLEEAKKVTASFGGTAFVPPAAKPEATDEAARRLLAYFGPVLDNPFKRRR